MPLDQVRRYGSLNLPLIRSNENLSEDADYVNSAVEQVDELTRYTSIGASSRILDFGCGQGRFANGLLARALQVERYCGVDAQMESIEWCQKWISEPHPEFEFVHVAAHNERYNAGAELRPRIPVEDESFDIAFVNSVFSHMLANDVVHYLLEIHRALRERGLLYLTAFLEDDVPNVEENPHSYLGRLSSGRLHRVRYERSYFLGLINTSGFELAGFRYRGIERTKQSVVVGRKFPRGA